MAEATEPPLGTGEPVEGTAESAVAPATSEESISNRETAEAKAVDEQLKLSEPAASAEEATPKPAEPAAASAPPDVPDSSVEASSKAGPAEDPAEAKETKPRTRIGQGRCVGLIVEWKGYMGWIQPLARIQHGEAKRHKGRIYLNQDDVATAPHVTATSSSASDLLPQRVKEGKIVDFFIYVDADGLGAEECRVRSVLRLTLPHSEAGRKLRDSPQWSEYLSDSEYYPAFEREHGVLLRKYAWPLPFAVLELWGAVEDLVSAAVRLSTPEDSQNCDVRLLLPEEDVPKVEMLPGSPKVSAHVVVPRPLRCRSLMLQSSREQCAEGIRAFLRLMSPLGAPGAGGGA